jgi:hypothetical protein
VSKGLFYLSIQFNFNILEVMRKCESCIMYIKCKMMDLFLARYYHKLVYNLGGDGDRDIRDTILLIRCRTLDWIILYNSSICISFLEFDSNY